MVFNTIYDVNVYIGKLLYNTPFPYIEIDEKKPRQ